MRFNSVNTMLEFIKFKLELFSDLLAGNGELTIKVIGLIFFSLEHLLQKRIKQRIPLSFL